MIEAGGIEHRLRLSPAHRVPGDKLPDFAQGAINLGRELYRSAVAGQPRTVILAVPSRDFFSALLSLGAAEAALSCGPRETTKPTPGELVIALYESGGFHVAIFEGEEEDTRESGRMRTFLSLKGQQRISAYSEMVTLLKHPRGPKGRSALSTLGLMHEAPPEVIAAQAAFGMQAVHDLYLDTPASTSVGTKSWIEEDLEDFRFSLDDMPGCEATLGDLLLASHSGFLPPLLDVQTYIANDLSAINSPLTILDGANVPLRHGVDVGNGSQVIVLDATTPQATLDLAVSSVANRLAFYAQDPDWLPLYHAGLALTERASYLRKTTR